MKSAVGLTNQAVKYAVVLLAAILPVKALSAQTSFALGSLDSSQSVEKRTADFVCELSLFFSVDPEDRLDHATSASSLEGRGLLTCHNSQGFSTELPVLANLQADLPLQLPVRAPASPALASVSAAGDPTTVKEVSFSGNTTPFVIPREVNQIYDVYSIREFSWEKNQSATEPSVLFRGAHNDLVIKMKLTSKTSNLAGLKVKGLRLSFDEKAPDIY